MRFTGVLYGGTLLRCMDVSPNHNPYRHTSQPLQAKWHVVRVCADLFYCHGVGDGTGSRKGGWTHGLEHHTPSNVFVRQPFVLGSEAYCGNA